MTMKEKWQNYIKVEDNDQENFGNQEGKRKNLETFYRKLVRQREEDKWIQRRKGREKKE